MHDYVMKNMGSSLIDSQELSELALVVRLIVRLNGYLQKPRNSTSTGVEMNFATTKIINM